MSFVGPFPLAATVARLKDQVSALRLIGTAADLRSAIEDKPRAVPAAFVLKEERSSPPSGSSNGVLVQMCQERCKSCCSCATPPVNAEAKAPARKWTPSSPVSALRS